MLKPSTKEVSHRKTVHVSHKTVDSNPKRQSFLNISQFLVIKRGIEQNGGFSSRRITLHGLASARARSRALYDRVWRARERAVELPPPKSFFIQIEETGAMMIAGR